jgi:TonB family protein
VAAAPAGLAAAVTGAALAGGAIAGSAVAGAAAAGGTATAVMNFMSMTKLQIGLASTLAVAGATGFVLEANSNAALREEAGRLRNENTAIATLQRENEQLTRLALEVQDLRGDDTEFAGLQSEAGTLKTRLQTIARTEQARQTQRDQSGTVFDLAKLDQAPRARFQARPQYPFEMRRERVNGEVVVDFVVDANGAVQKAYALRSSRREFEAAAVEAVSKWIFNPGRKGGLDVQTHMQVPIVFTVDNPREESKPLATDPNTEKFVIKLSPVPVSGSSTPNPTDGSATAPRP